MAKDRILLLEQLRQAGVDGDVNFWRERIQGLNCLYGVSQLAERHLDSVDALLQELVDFLPYPWQYPDATCARILFDGSNPTPATKSSRPAKAGFFF